VTCSPKEGLNTPASTPFSVSTINNFGTINNRGTITHADTIINNGTFTNSGFVNITSTGLFTTSTNYKQTAGRTFVNGTLTATGPAIVDIHAGILGGGTINGNVLMAGRMIAGMPGTPLTFLINGNYEQRGTGIYDELISGNANGLLQVSGAAKLDPGSSLDVFLLGGFDPSNGTSFTTWITAPRAAGSRSEIPCSMVVRRNGLSPPIMAATVTILY